ncbi:metallophosphoesterase family protein [Halomarina litorea]|uniref:metallophosphoesterase family protein n=1 Tax=Halomarina litorea TaxID=2961595 RepID=UPI0020C4F9A9|nr:metallophosphoesterase family protein [Halomarina sp. BCD28]
MRIGLLSDVHANAVALAAVREAMPDVEAVVCAGDVVGYNPHPAECVEAVREAGWPTVQGNHDRVVATPDRYRHNEMAHAGLRYAYEHLDSAQLSWLADLPESRTLFDGQVRVVHSHPTERDRYVMPRGFAALEPHLGDERVLVLGHTHVQHHERVDGTLVVNPGSVGQPRDGDPRAAFAVLDLEASSVSVTAHRVEYDVERVRADVAAADLPERTGARLARGE